MRRIGSGTFGEVFETKYPDIVEKMVLLNEYHEYGVPCGVIQEVSILKALDKCPFIVPFISFEFNLVENYISLLFKRYKYDLTMIRSSNNDDDILKIIYQILLALRQAQSLNILHRDLKLRNVFLNSENDVVVGDWGLATVKTNNLCNNVQTLHYRAPEILLGATQYGNEIDIWSLGCILYALHNNFKVLFQANVEKKQILRIFKLLGSPTDIFQLHTLPRFQKDWPIFQRHVHNLNLMKNEFPSNPVWDLFIHMIELNPSKRETIDWCLKHVCFDTIRSMFPMPNLPQLIFQPKLNFLKDHIDVNLKMRLILFDWIYLVCLRLKVDLSCFFLTFQLVDSYLEAKPQLERQKLQLVGIVCLMRTRQAGPW